MAILVTGGAGYIGSHCVRALLEREIDTVVLDRIASKRAAILGGAKLYDGGVSDRELTGRIFRENPIDCVIHFAAYLLVHESVESPQKYYENNVCGTISLLGSMIEAGVKNFIYSSSASVYGVPKFVPLTEDHPLDPASPYGQTKLAVEQALKWYGNTYGLRYACMRYFNAAGAHPSGELGEDHAVEVHLIPNILYSVLGKNGVAGYGTNGGVVRINGNDYNTKDGTCVRDYIHVCDLADAHIKAYEYLSRGGESGVFNVGSGTGYSNLEILEAARAVTGKSIPAEFGPRRPGDPDASIASNEKAERALGWKRQYTDIKDIIATAWKWHSSHPNGFTESV